MYEDLHAISHKALNMAQDIRINDFIRQEKGMQTPEDALLPEAFNFPPKLSAREYFELLMKMAKQCAKCGAKYIEMPGQGGDQGEQGDGQQQEGQGGQEGKEEQQEGQGGQGGHQCHEDGCGCTAQPELGDAAGAPRREDGQLIREITARELEKAQRDRGNGSCDYGGWLEAFRNPPVDPKRLLRRALTNLIQAPGIEDYSWSRPNNRQPIGSKVLMPGMVDGRPGHVAIVIDTSGSMADAEVAAALSVCNAVFAYADRVTEIQCDTVAQKSRGVGRKQRQIYHRGGTDMGVGIQAAERERPDLLVVISDCETPWPNNPPKMPMVIVRVGNGGQLPPWKVVDVVDMKVGRKG
jgi:predicted metal-dependent peptidase